MNFDKAPEIKTRLYAQAQTLIEKAAGSADDSLIEALLEVCSFLETSAESAAPVVAAEREVHSQTGTYHFSVRRLNTSVPVGKFQIIITRQLASGLIY